MALLISGFEGTPFFDTSGGWEARGASTILLNTHYIYVQLLENTLNLYF